MALQAHPPLVPGRIYRSRDLADPGHGESAVQALVAQGQLVPLGHGLYHHPKASRFGAVPPSEEELLRAVLNGSRFLVTGPEKWNALGLGATASFAQALVYNTKRSGPLELGGKRFLLRRVSFPNETPPEWFVVDLLKNAERAGVDRSILATALGREVKAGNFDPEKLKEMAHSYGDTASRALIEAVVN